MFHRSLIAQALQGEKPASERIARHCLPILYRYFTKAWKASRPEAEELIQDTFEELWKALGSFRGDAIEPWLLTIARRVAWRHYHETIPTSALSENTTPIGEHELALPTKAPTQEELTITKDRYNKLMHTFSQLRTEYREVLHLYYLEDFSVEELACALDIPYGTAKTWLQRARKELFQLWKRSKRAQNKGLAMVGSHP